MCKRDELIETIGIAGQKGCDPGQVVRLLRNATRQAEDSGSELTPADMAAIVSAKDAAKLAALANFEVLLKGI